MDGGEREEWGKRGSVRGDRAVAGKHTLGAVRSQHLNTHLLKAAIQLLTAREREGGRGRGRETERRRERVLSPGPNPI